MFLLGLWIRRVALFFTPRIKPRLKRKWNSRLSLPPLLHTMIWSIFFLWRGKEGGDVMCLCVPQSTLSLLHPVRWCSESFQARRTWMSRWWVLRPLNRWQNGLGEKEWCLVPTAERNRCRLQTWKEGDPLKSRIRRFLNWKALGMFYTML